MIASENCYWIHSSALNFTLNALDAAHLIQCNVANSAVIQCFINHVDEEDTLGFSASHSYKSWKLAAGPTRFNTPTAKYVYAAIPKDPGNNTAIIVYPSEKLDIYGRNESGEQVGSSNHYYIWLQGVISAEKTQGGRTYREWNPYISTGKLDTPEGDLEQLQSSEWYSYIPHFAMVSFLKQIQMAATSWFSNIRLGSNKHNLTGVATGETADEYMDSDELVATPSYIKANYVSKKNDDTIEGNITFGQNINVGGNAIINGILQVGSWIKAQWAELAYIKSPDYTGDGLHDTGFLLTNNANGHSKLTIDELYVRMKAVFEELQIKKETVTGGNEIHSCAASIISFTRFINSQGQDVSYHTVNRPIKFRGVPIAITRALANTRLLRDFLSKSVVERKTFTEEEFAQSVNRVRCYFLAKEGEQEIENWWHSNENGHDLARCQTFNLVRKSRETYLYTGPAGDSQNVFWWRKVMGVSSTPVEVDGKMYHWFDVYVGSDTSGFAPNSDIPAAGDHVSQWGNDADVDRMNLISVEVNGEDAPAVKMYEGVNTFSMQTGIYGNPLKCRLSPKAGYKFQGKKFDIITEYAVKPIPIERGPWADIPEHLCYYYDIVQHNGATWLCVAAGNQYMVDESFTHEGTPYPVNATLTQAQYDGLTVDEQVKCHCQTKGSTTAEPQEDSPSWIQYAAKGEKGDDGNGIKKITRTYGISAESTTANETTAPSDISLWAASSPAVTEGKPYLWAKEIVEYTKSAATTKYYMIGARGDNGVDAKDVEWVYVRTTENVAPTIIDESGDGYKADDFKPLAKVTSGRIKGMTEGNANVSVRCTDDPQGVNDTWKYEWEIKRTKGNATNGHREWQKYSGTMTLHNNLSESAFVIDLDNNADQFSTDSTGKVLVEQKRSTKASLYYGSQEQALTALSASLKYEDGTSVASSVASVTADKTTGIVEVTIKVNNTISHAEIVATITATCARGNKTITFPIQKVMSGAPGANPVIYQLAPTQKAFSFGRDASNNLTPSNASSRINVAKTEGNTTTILTSAQTGITYSWGFENEATPASGHSGLAVGTSITISNSDAANHTSVWVELSTGDRETLPITKDGEKGDKGDNAVHLDIDNEHEDFLYNDTELVSPAVGAVVTPRLYDGGVQVTTGITWTVSMDDGLTWYDPANHPIEGRDATVLLDSEGGVIVYGLNVLSAKVIIRALYKGLYYYADFTANKTMQDKYDLSLIPNAISYNPVTYPANGVTITPSATHTDLQGTTEIVDIKTDSDIAEGHIYLFYGYVNSSGVIGEMVRLTNSTYTAMGNSVAAAEGVYFELRKAISYDETSEEWQFKTLDYDTIPFAKVQNGKDAVRLDLDNEMDSILYDGANNKVSGNVSTTVYIYEGANDVSSQITAIRIISSENISSEQVSINGRAVTVSGLTADGYVIIGATYKNKEYNAKFSVKKISGKDKFELSVMPNAISVNTSDAQQSDRTISVQVYRTPANGGERHAVEWTNKTGSNYLLALVVKDSTDTSLEETTGAGTVTTRTFKFSAAQAQNSNITSINISLGKKENPQLPFVTQDTETIPVARVSNGINGTGANAVRLDLDNEMDVIPVDADRKTTDVVSVSTTVRLFDGATQVPLTTSDVVSVETIVIGGTPYGGVKSGSGGITITWTLDDVGTTVDFDRVTPTIVVVKNNKTYTIKFVVAVVKSGKPGVSPAIMQLLPSPSQVIFKEGDTSSKTVTMSIKKTIGDETSVITIAESGLSVRYSFDHPATSTDVAWPEQNLSIAPTTNRAQIYVAAFNGTALVDRETIPIIKDGTTGRDAISGYADFLFGKDAEGNQKPAASADVLGMIDLLDYEGSSDRIDVCEYYGERYSWEGYGADRVPDGATYVSKTDGHLYIATANGWQDEGMFRGENALTYKMSIDRNTFAYDPNIGKKKVSIKAHVQKIDGTKTELLKNLTKSNFALSFVTVRNTESGPIEYEAAIPPSAFSIENGTYVICTNGDNTQYAGESFFRIKFLIDNKEMAVENIPIVEYGTDGHDGTPGARGPRGRSYYFAQEWNGEDYETKYSVTEEETPYFLYEGEKYIFEPENNGEYTMPEMGTPDPDNPNWSLMVSSLKYLIIKALFGDYAELDRFIFNRNHMFSEYGINVATGEVEPRGSLDYYGIVPQGEVTNTFLPSVSLDAVEGRASFSRDKVRFNPDGSGWLAGEQISWDKNGNAAFRGRIAALAGSTFSGFTYATHFKREAAVLFGDDITYGDNAPSVYYTPFNYSSNLYLHYPGNHAYDEITIYVLPRDANNGRWPTIISVNGSGTEQPWLLDLTAGRLEKKKRVQVTGAGIIKIFSDGQYWNIMQGTID